MAAKILMPKLSDTMTEGVILKWLKNEGDSIKQGEILVEIESDKADMELESYDTGILRKILIPEGGKAPIGDVIGIIGEADEDIASFLKSGNAEAAQHQTGHAEVRPETLSAPSQVSATTSGGRIKASPLARKIADEKKIDLHTLTGSGPEGRIIKRDVNRITASSSAAAGPQAAKESSGGYKDVELSLIRKTIAKRMQESKQQVPHFYVTIEIDMESAISLRGQYIETTGIKISFTDIVVKAASLALLKNPNINAAFIDSATRQFDELHIAVAVALDEGLVTPVLRNCKGKSVAQLNEELRDLADRARKRKLKPEEYQGATFTVSNLGMFGVEDFTAIINPPEGAILAVGAILEKPVVKNGSITPGHIMKVTLSSDHRIIDGAVAARFLQDLKKLLENPLAVFL
jgi:pyruvate dehydrogenase E2 component (dihydrolipoamide acetyltransferase)